MDMKNQLKVLGDAMAKRAKATGKKYGPAELSKDSGVALSECARYVSDDKKRHMKIGPKNAPKIATALGLPIMVVLYGKEEKARS